LIRDGGGETEDDEHRERDDVHDRDVAPRALHDHPQDQCRNHEVDRDDERITPCGGKKQRCPQALAVRHVRDDAEQALHDVIGANHEVQREGRHRRNQHAGDEAGPLRATNTGEQRWDEVRRPDLDCRPDAHQPRRTSRVSGEPRDREEHAERRDAVELSM
jgi:hypothetical protein